MRLSILELSTEKIKSFIIGNGIIEDNYLLGEGEAIKANYVLIFGHNNMQIYNLDGRLLKEFRMCKNNPCHEHILLQAAEYEGKFIIYSQDAGDIK